MITNTILATYQDEVLYMWDREDDFSTLCGDEALKFFNSFKEYALQDGNYFIRHDLIVDMRAVKAINAKGNIDFGLQMPWIPDLCFVEFYKAWKLGLRIIRKDHIAIYFGEKLIAALDRRNLIEMMNLALILNLPDELTLKQLRLIRNVLREEIL